MFVVEFKPSFLTAENSPAAAALTRWAQGMDASWLPTSESELIIAFDAKLTETIQQALAFDEDVERYAEDDTTEFANITMKTTQYV